MLVETFSLATKLSMSLAHPVCLDVVSKWKGNSFINYNDHFAIRNHLQGITESF